MRNKPRILVAEDEKDIGRLVAFALESRGFEVTLVADGRAAVEAAESGSYDLILLDVMMPNMNGYEAAKLISARDPSQPIAMLSAKAQKGEVQRGLECGAVEYICKPFNPKELAERVKELVERGRHNDS